MSKKKILVICASVIVVLGGTLGFFVYKNITEQPEQVVEQQEDVAVPEDTAPNKETPQTSKPQVQTIARGQFVDGDAIHSGQGTATVTETEDGPILSFSSDFKVTTGPDLFVYLSPNSADQDLGAFASLGELKKFEGSQAYNLPKNYKDYKTVVIWCRAFSTTFATAELKNL